MLDCNTLIINRLRNRIIIGLALTGVEALQECKDSLRCWVFLAAIRGRELVVLARQQYSPVYESSSPVICTCAPPRKCLFTEVRPVRALELRESSGIADRRTFRHQNRTSRIDSRYRPGFRCRYRKGRRSPSGCEAGYAVGQLWRTFLSIRSVQRRNL